MAGRITEEMVVENLLSKYPIKERNDERQWNALVATLLNGEKRLIEFEKKIVPAEVVGKYIVAEHTFPILGTASTKHNIEPIGEYANYADAHQAYYIKAEQVIKGDTDKDPLKQIVLVGEYKDSKLDFDTKGMPDVNTGVTLGSILSKFQCDYLKMYPDKEPADPTSPVTINNKLYVELDMGSATLKFEQNFLQRNELNVDLWRMEDCSHLISKYSRNIRLSEDHKDMTTEQWVVDPLLIKKTDGKGHGKSI